MDPWYFLDLECNLKDEHDDEIPIGEISDISSIYPDGSWMIHAREFGTVRFKGTDYLSIDFNTDTNQLTCMNDHTEDIYSLHVVLNNT